MFVSHSSFYALVHLIMSILPYTAFCFLGVFLLFFSSVSESHNDYMLLHRSSDSQQDVALVDG